MHPWRRMEQKTTPHSRGYNMFSTTIRWFSCPRVRQCLFSNLSNILHKQPVELLSNANEYLHKNDFYFVTPYIFIHLHVLQIHTKCYLVLWVKKVIYDLSCSVILIERKKLAIKKKNKEHYGNLIKNSNCSLMKIQIWSRTSQ